VYILAESFKFVRFYPLGQNDLPLEVINTVGIPVEKNAVCSSVPDPPDPRVFLPPGSGSTSQWYGYGSGSGSGSGLSSYKNYKKNLESYYFVTLFDFYLRKII
jgi:hypothetical protein